MAPSAPRRRVAYRAPRRSKRSDPARRRRNLLTGFVISIVTVLVASGIISGLVAAGSGDTSDKIGTVANVLTAATLLLAVIAAIVAIVAYAVSTGTPELKLSARVGDSNRNAPDLRLGENGTTRPDWDIALTILLRNTSSYSARNPAVTVRIEGFGFPDDASFRRENPQWTIIDHDENGEYAVAAQWDGGPNYSVHGNSIRTLPVLAWSKLTALSDIDIYRTEPQLQMFAPSLQIGVLAEGYRRTDVQFFRIYEGANLITKGEQDREYWV